MYRDRECKHCRMIKKRLEEEKEKEDKMDEEFIKEEHERILKEKGKFIPLEEI
jgi:hypothetical protein